jgi:carbonic anhydrase
MDVGEKHEAEMSSLPNEQRFDRLCELNVHEQVVNVCQTTVVKDAWARGQDLTVHGVVYSLEDGLLRDLGVSANG